jgi:hypothetical protein
MAGAKDIKNIFVVLLLGAILLPIALTQLANANTTGWDATVITVFGLLSLIGIVVVILKMLDKV